MFIVVDDAHILHNIIYHGVPLAFVNDIFVRWIQHGTCYSRLSVYVDTYVRARTHTHTNARTSVYGTFYFRLMYV